uniref:acetyl-CoA carboxylase carboxyltransferase beta subunit n=1 Tax=Limnobium laevigatum TaxID=62342 RepID=UPI001F133C06|nr:acetyl-CoA carboxylase carboxyltransferase beta subunit [Limnobium laevigatum]UKT61006.1 acetyl-CoA carboxylase carboxyltransferase beta subunit [Limnobium laevigatum]
MEKWWFNSMSSNKKLDHRWELNKLMYSLDPIEDTSESKDPVINDTNKNMHDSGSCNSTNVERLFDIRDIWTLISDDTFLVRDSNGDNYFVYLDIENLILEIDNDTSFSNELESSFSNYLNSNCLNSRSKSKNRYYSMYDTSWNNHINNCIDSYLHSQISIDSSISGGTENYNDNYIYNFICRNSSIRTGGNGNDFPIRGRSNDEDTNDLDINDLDINDLDINDEDILDINDLDINDMNDEDMNYFDIHDEDIDDEDMNNPYIYINGQDMSYFDMNYQDMNYEDMNYEDMKYFGIGYLLNICDQRMKYRDIDDLDMNDEDMNDEDMNDEDMNDEDINDEDMNDEDMNDEDMNYEDINYEDMNDEDMKYREDIKYLGINYLLNICDQRMKYRDIDDLDIDDLDMNDEDMNDEDMNDEDMNDEDMNDQDTNDQDTNHLSISQKYGHLWVQCENCYGLNYKKFFRSKMNICEECGYHLKMSSSDRIELLIDPGTWNPMNEDMVSTDPIEFDSEDEPYKDRIHSYQRKTGLTEAVQTGIGQLNGIPLTIGVMDFQFMGGSMGSVVGEKITRLIEYATNRSLPLIIVCASGGARMQEGSLSLMQMAKISSALFNYQLNKKLFYVSILTSPTTGGVTASFGMLGDVIIAEPNAYIAFAGKRVIEQTLNTTVPDGSQEAEYLFDKGLFDSIVPRNPLKGVLSELFQLHGFFPNSRNEKE